MNAEQTKQLRLSILRHLQTWAGRRFGMCPPLLLQHLRSEGAEALPSDVAAELEYLADKGMAEVKRDTLSPELSGWRITSEGRDYLASFQG